MVYEEVKNFFANIDCFLKCIYGDLKKKNILKYNKKYKQHIEIQQKIKTKY